MPQNNERSSNSPMDYFVSDIDYSEAQTILDLTMSKQKQLRRQRSNLLYKQLLLKRTYANVCDLLDSDCSTRKSMPLSAIDTNKRKMTFDESNKDRIVSKKAKTSPDTSIDLAHDNDILQFLLELNSVKVAPRY